MEFWRSTRVCLPLRDQVVARPAGKIEQTERRAPDGKHLPDQRLRREA